MIKDFHKVAIIAGEREVTYTQLLQRIHLYAERTPRGAATKTLILAENSEYWLYAFFAIWYNGGIAVPVDATSTVDDIAYILRDSQPEALWVSQQCEPQAREAAEQAGLNVLIQRLDDMPLAAADGLPTDYPEPDREQTALIIYTSGTTGSPKGVMLSYRNLWANITGVADVVPIFTPERRVMILLPVHHVLPLMGSLIAPIVCGGGVAICPSLSGPDIMQTMCRGRVAIFIGVPRLWQMLYTGIKKKIDQSAATRALFRLCEKVGSPRLSRLVFSSVRKKMGGHIDYCVSGGAALDPEIGRGLRTLGLDVLEGYGMTETAPIITFTRPDDIIPGCAGRPLPAMDVKIINGEVCAKGPNVMQGYYNRPEETAAVIDKDGYIHTGDLGRIDPEGRVYITGRTKEIIVLSNGKNVQPNEIEYRLEKYDQWVKEAAVTWTGDMLCAIIVPDLTFSATLTDAQVEEELKRHVLEPYNLSVENYKKVMRLVVFRGDLPRTKLDKLQRFKLKAIVEGQQHPTEHAAADLKDQTPEYRLLAQYIFAEKHIMPRPTDHLETDLALDSLDRVALQAYIQQTFGTDVNAELLASFPNLDALAQHVARAKTHIDETETDWQQIMQEDTSALTLPHTSPLMPFHMRLLAGITRLYNRLAVSGQGNIPAHGPFILAPNHQSYIDAPIAVAGLNAEQLRQSYFYATEEHVKGRLLRRLAQRNNVIIMERKALKASIQKLAETLKRGKNIVIFPEGSRTHDGHLIRFKKTYAILALELHVPIIPVCIKGVFEALPRDGHAYRPHKITVEYLTPVVPAPDDTYDTLSERVREAIAAHM